jgi:predicted flap endonuclease-1-like 5' DNA nuclease
LTFSFAQIATVLILACSSFISGWLLRRIQAKAREALLQKSLAEAQGIIPQLETNVRTRDQRLGSLVDELTAWKAKVPTLEASVKRRDIEVLAKERELKVVRTELTALKDVAVAAPKVTAEEIDALRESLRVAQTRTSELIGDLAERDRRLAAAAAAQAVSNAMLPAGETGPESTPALAPSVDWTARIGVLEADIRQRDQNVADLLARLDGEVQRRNVLEAECGVRAAEIERLRDEAAKWQARVPKLVATIKSRDVAITDHETALAQRDKMVGDRDAMIGERDITIVKRDVELAEKNALLTDSDRVAAGLRVELQQRDVAARTSSTAAEQQIAALKEHIDAAAARADALTGMLADRDTALGTLEARLAAQAREFDAMLAQNTAKLATALRLGREDIDSHRAAVTALENERAVQNSRIAELEQDLESSSVQHAEATAERQKQAEWDAGRLAELAGQHDQLNERLSSALAEFAIGERQRSVLEAERNALAERSSALLQQLATAEQSVATAQQSAMTLQQTLDMMQEREAETQTRLIESEALRVSEQTERVSAGQRMTTLQQQQLSAEHEVVGLRQALTTLKARVEHAEAQRQDVLSQREALEDRIGALLSQQSDVKESSVAMQRVLNAAREEQLKIAAELSRRDEEVAALRDELTHGGARAAPLEAMLRERDTVLAERARHIESLTSQIETLDATLRQRAARISELEKAFAATEGGPPGSERRADYLEQRVAAQIEKNRELSRTLEERERELALLSKQRELNDKSLLVLKQQLDGAREAEERLAVQVRELKAAQAAVAERPPERTEQALERSEDAPLETQPQGLYPAAPDKVDDLQQIRGIGEGFERGLNKLGFYRYSQLAGLSAPEIVWVENNLPTFRGRVERDDWPGQAAALIAAQPGEWSLRTPPVPNGSANGPLN